MPYPPKDLKDLNSLIQIIADLRGPEGCPWDLDQNHQTLASYAIEEVHELVEAIEQKDDLHMCEELGDVLFQVVLHSRLAEERNKFNLSDVIEAISKKIVRRHPHVFAGLKITDKNDILINWDAIKKLEKANTPAKIKKSIEVPESLPALQRAFKIGEKTKVYGFDWNELKTVISQLKAELTELEDALAEPEGQIKDQHVFHEMGDVLFSAAQVARHLEIEPESSLREANRRFLGRFEKMLTLGKVTADEFAKLTSKEKESLWCDAKKES